MAIRQPNILVFAEGSCDLWLSANLFISQSYSFQWCVLWLSANCMQTIAIVHVLMEVWLLSNNIMLVERLLSNNIILAVCLLPNNIILAFLCLHWVSMLCLHLCTFFFACTSCSLSQLPPTNFCCPSFLASAEDGSLCST